MNPTNEKSKEIIKIQELKEEILHMNKKLNKVREEICEKKKNIIDLKEKSLIIIQETNKLKIDLQIEEDNELAKIIRDQEEKNSNSYQYNVQYAKEEIYEEKKEFEVFSTHEENSKEIKKYEANPNKRKKNRCWEIKKILNTISNKNFETQFKSFIRIIKNADENELNIIVTMIFSSLTIMYSIRRKILF